MVCGLLSLFMASTGLLTPVHLGTTGGKTLSQIDANDPDISPARLQFITEHLAAMVNRNTSTDHLDRAAQWVASQYKTIPGLQVQLFSYTVHQGPRVPETKTVHEVMAILPGRDDERVLMGGHLDSINMRVPADIESLETARAPGADDDLSGMASTMEVARVMAKRHWQHTLVFFAFSGEEQGLFGSKAFADYAKAQNWNILGFLNNDMVGSGHDDVGHRKDSVIRLYSPADPLGHGSRDLAQFIEWIQASKSKEDNPYFNSAQTRSRHPQAFNARLEFRLDRYLRGGDHISFIRNGFPAIRFTEPYESFTHQHSPFDLPKYVDFQYEANAARINLLAMSALAQSAPAPTDVRIKLDLSHDTDLSWRGNPNQTYVVYWRPTAAPNWQTSIRVKGLHAHIRGVSKDDYIFAVGSPSGVPVLAR